MRSFQFWWLSRWFTDLYVLLMSFLNWSLGVCGNVYLHTFMYSTLSYLFATLLKHTSLVALSPPPPLVVDVEREGH